MKWFVIGNKQIRFNLKNYFETESYNKIVEFIRTKKSVTKNEILLHMGWGVRIGFTTYRNRLRNEKDIKFTKKQIRGYK